MKKIIITEEVETTTELVTLLVHISNLVDEGYTQGYYPHWTIQDVQE
jgi:hypothetical protein